MLVLNGSPCRNGHTMTLCGEVLRRMSGRVETIHLYDADIAPCRACGGCGTSGKCCLAGGGMEAILASLKQARILILASPLHFTSLTAPMLAFISRLQPLWRRRRHMVQAPATGWTQWAAVVLTAGSSYPNMFQPARSVALAAFNTLGMGFAGMATATSTDTVPVLDNAKAMEEAIALSEQLRSPLSALPSPHSSPPFG